MLRIYRNIYEIYKYMNISIISFNIFDDLLFQLKGKDE